MAFWDWLIVGAYFLVSAAIGISLSRRAGTDPAQYFASGRSLPWWLAGTSMVATTFAADTPLAVAGMVASHGIAGNWLWWSMVMSNVLTVFFFARLWRRSEVLTDAELSELRYDGKPAAVLRGFRAVYMAFPINLVITGWVNLAMVKILGATLGTAPELAMLIMAAITLTYALVSGLWGVVVTDFLQFSIAMVGSVVLALFAVQAVGGLEGLVSRLPEHFGEGHHALELFPTGDGWMPAVTFFAYLGVQWWATSYPGSEPGGGGYVAQRIFGSRSERDGILATLWFTVAHYAVRPWPWIITALVVVVLNPGSTDPGSDYIRATLELLPTGARGLMLAAFAAAYMSTISSQLNWGASYLVNDLYVRFLRPQASPKSQVRVARLSTALIFALSLAVTYLLARAGSIEAGWRIVIALGAGTGPVLILRWYWWRVNAWSEIVAMAAAVVSFVVLTLSGTFDPAHPVEGTYLMLATTAVVTLSWLVATFVTAPTSDATLQRFYRRVHPGGPGWRRVREQLGMGDESIAGGRRAFVNWVAGVIAVYSSLFGVGALLFRTKAEAAAWLTAAVLTFAWIGWSLRREEQTQAQGREARTLADSQLLPLAGPGQGGLGEGEQRKAPSALRG